MRAEESEADSCEDDWKIGYKYKSLCEIKQEQISDVGVYESDYAWVERDRCVLEKIG